MLNCLTINKELEAFTYISSHDMQEPLRKIQTYSRIIEIDKNLMSENGLKYFKIIDKEAMRMQTLIKNLLTFSHLNTTERKFELCDLNKVAEEILVELKLQIKKRSRNCLEEFAYFESYCISVSDSYCII